MRYLVWACGLLAVAWLLPNHYMPWPCAYQDALAAMSLLACYAIAAADRGWRLPLPRSAAVVAVVALIPVFQWGAGLIFFVGDAVMAAAYLLAFAAAIVTGCALAARNAGDHFAVVLASMVLVGAVASGAIQLVQWLRISALGIWVIDLRPGAAPYGNLGQPNQQATLLCMGVAALIYLFEARKLGVASALLVAGYMIPLIAMTQSRTPWIGALALALATWQVRRRLSLRTPAWALVAGIGLYAFLVVVWSSINAAMFLQGQSLAQRVSPGTRPTLWLELIAAVFEKPWFGWGWNQVVVALSAVAYRFPASELVEHSHNIVIDLLVWNGIPVGILLVTVICVWGYTRMRTVCTLEGAFGVMFLMFFGAHTLVEFPHDYLYFLVPAGFAIGLVDAHVGRPAWTLRPHVVVGILACGAAASSWVFHEYRIIEDDTRLMRFEALRIGTLKAAQPAPDVILLDHQREFLRFARGQAKPGMSAAELEWMGRVAHRYPYPPSLFRYAIALGLNGRIDDARRELATLRQLHGEERFREAIEGVRGMVSSYPALERLIEGWQGDNAISS